MLNARSMGPGAQSPMRSEDRRFALENVRRVFWVVDSPCQGIPF